MNKKFTDNEVRAYSKNRFEERALRRRLEKLRDELLLYHDTSARDRIDLLQETRELRRTSGGGPVPAEMTDGEEDVCVDSRLRRPWAYSAMETTYNSVYREAQVQTPRRFKRPRAKSAVTSTVFSLSSGHTGRDGCGSRNLNLPKIPRTSQSATNARGVCFMNTSGSGDSQDLEDKSHLTGKLTGDEDQSLLCASSDSNQTDTSRRENSFQLSLHSTEESDEDASCDQPGSMFADLVVDHRPYARVLSLPPAYTIDSRAYQEAERDRLVQRSRSRVSFSSPAGVAFVQSDLSSNKDKPDKLNEKSNTNDGTKENETVNEQVKSQEDSELISGSNPSHQDMFDEKNNHTIKAAENVKFKGQVIRNYIRPEDRYKLDPSILNRRQMRMDKLAKESATYLKRINHENIRVEIAFPRSARRRLLARLVQENNIGRKKTVTNVDAPIIQSKVERFMVSMAEYIDKQQLERSKSSIF